MANKSAKSTDIAKNNPDLHAGSKPMVVGHKPLARDPMMRAGEEQQAPEKPLQPPSKKQVAPVSTAKKASESQTKKQAKTATQPSSTSTEVEQKKEPSKQSETPESTADTPESPPLDPQAVAVERQQTLEKLIASKEYHVTVARPGIHLKTFFIVFFTALLVMLAACYIAIDAGLFDVGIELPFDFISNS